MSGDAATETVFATDTGPRGFAAGDRIVFTCNDKEIGVKNGILGTVETIDADQITVRLDGDGGIDRRISFHSHRFRSFDHGYAVTIHKSQGATVDRAYVLASRTMDAPLTYVAMTRHRETLRLYLSDEDKPNWAEPESGRILRRSKRMRTLDRS